MRWMHLLFLLIMVDCGCYPSSKCWFNHFVQIFQLKRSSLVYFDLMDEVCFRFVYIAVFDYFICKTFCETEMTTLIKTGWWWRWWLQNLMEIFEIASIAIVLIVASLLKCKQGVGSQCAVCSSFNTSNIDLENDNVLHVAYFIHEWQMDLRAIGKYSIQLRMNREDLMEP